jgi:glycosyltransferase involved in cell wall biosynthesis
MIHIFLNGLAASAGGGLTYLRNVVPHLSARGDVKVSVAVPPVLREEFSSLPNIACLEIDTPGGATRRFWQEQTVLPRWIRRTAAEVLISAGNFALRRPPVPQILLSRSALYTSRDFVRDLRVRGDYRMWLDTRMRGILAKRSIRWANCTVAPSQAFAEELRQWTGFNVAIRHGFDHEAFLATPAPLPVDVQEKLEASRDALRLLLVSHYNYYRNFETVFRALPLLHKRLNGRDVRLFLTCRLQSAYNPGSYRAEAASALVKQLGISENVIELGAVPYSSLHQLYRVCHIYVTAAYSESFAHPLVEAMASGVPIVASDIPVHREICGDAALFFPRFSPQELSERILQVARPGSLAEKLAELGRVRSHDFSWSQHVEQIISLARGLVQGRAV